jgi:transcriptional regulator with XRE-family HTH domain
MNHVLLKYCRQISGLTQKQLSAKAGISEAYYCKVEKGVKRLTPAVKDRLMLVFAEAGIDVNRMAIIQTLIENRK